MHKIWNIFSVYLESLVNNAVTTSHYTLLDSTTLVNNIFNACAWKEPSYILCDWTNRTMQFEVLRPNCDGWSNRLGCHPAQWKFIFGETCFFQIKCRKYPWEWRHTIYPNGWKTSTTVHGVTSQTTVLIKYMNYLFRLWLLPTNPIISSMNKILQGTQEFVFHRISVHLHYNILVKSNGYEGISLQQVRVWYAATQTSWCAFTLTAIKSV